MSTDRDKPPELVVAPNDDERVLTATGKDSIALVDSSSTIESMDFPAENRYEFC
jgi:hypothetical protein